MYTENIMPKGFVRNAINSLEGRRLPQHVSTRLGAATPGKCVWFVITTGSMLTKRTKISKIKKTTTRMTYLIKNETNVVSTSLIKGYNLFYIK